MIDFDIILDQIGHFGRYQVVLCCVVCWLGIAISTHLFSPVFYSARTPFRCNVTVIGNFPIFTNGTHEELLNLTTPYDENLSAYDTCRRYEYNESLCEYGAHCANKNSTPTTCEEGYLYDRSVFDETVITQWNLVCDRSYLITVETTMFFIGGMAGGMLAGYFSDRFGRKPTLICASFGNVIFGIIAALSPWFPLFAVGRFFVGMCAVGEDAIGEIYVMEIIAADKRALASVLAQIVISVGQMANSLIAYYLRNWRHFYLAISFTPVPFIVASVLLPESPRWHFSYSRDEIGKQITEKFAKYNRKELTQQMWDDAVQPTPISNQEKYSIVDLFKPPLMRWVTVKLMILWFVGQHSYIVFALNVTIIGNDIFLNNALNGVVSIAGLVFVALFIDRIGRRMLIGGNLLGCGICSLAITFIIAYGGSGKEFVIAAKVLYFASVFGSWVAGCALYIYTIELFPTVVRANGMGIATFSAAIGLILAPVVISTGQTLPWFPSALVAIGTLISGCLALGLPETKGVVMPQTIKEAEVFYATKSPNFSSFSLSTSSNPESGQQLNVHC